MALSTGKFVLGRVLSVAVVVIGVTALTAPVYVVGLLLLARSGRDSGW